MRYDDGMREKTDITQIRLISSSEKKDENIENIVRPNSANRMAVQTLPKKPFYKRWWFIAACAFLIIGIVTSGNNNEDEYEYADAGYAQEDAQESEADTGSVNEVTDDVSLAYEWAINEIETVSWISSPLSIRTRMLNQGGFSEELTNEVMEMLDGLNWTDRAFASLKDLVVYGSSGYSRNGLISELELGGHTDETISAVMQKIDDLGINWYDMAMDFINWHGPTSGFMNHENRFRDWMINDIGFTASEAQYAYDNFRANLDSEPYEAAAGETVSQMNAIRMAQNYLNFMPFSRSGLIAQLEFEGFSYEDAAHGVDSINANWYEQATKKAEQYLSMMAFSRSGLIDQLIFEGFTRSQAEHGVNAVGL